MQNLEPLHYVNCFVDLESLRPGKPLIPELKALVEWVCAKQTQAGSPTNGKLRLNSHGSDSQNAGFSMGGSSLSPDDLVDALIRHGLGTRAIQYTSSRQNLVAKESRWKADNEVTACEKCNNQFNFVRRRHHCRMCGGIFCDACTKKRRTLRNPLTEKGRGAGSVPDCRVCDDCASKADTIRTTETKASAGLAQITLAMCLTARNEREFADAKTGFARNSIASRVVKRLSMQGVHGIQVSGSNEVIKGTALQSFDLAYPGMSRAKKAKIKGPACDPSNGAGWAGVAIEEESLEIPCSILGSRGEPDPISPSILGDATYVSISDQRIVPICGGNKMAFGIFCPGTPEERLVRQAFRRWTFTSWRRIDEPVGHIAELTRVASELAATRTKAKEAGAAFFSANSKAFGRSTIVGQSTIVIDAPQRRITIKRDPRDANSLIVSGFTERRFKDFKVYEIS
jgi:hypothetical protein